MKNSHDAVLFSEPLYNVGGVVNAWCVEEEQFSANHYNGGSLHPGILLVPAKENASLIFTAPHSVNHTREGAVKYADRGTGGLAFALAQHLQCWGLAMGHKDSGDANWDEEHPLKAQLLTISPSPRILIDVHGMRTVEGEADCEIGTGATCSEENMVFAEHLGHYFKEAGLKVILNGKFSASKPATVTSTSQKMGMLAVQLELGGEWRPPLGSTANMQKVTEAITNTALSYLSH